ncbi:MAG: hypothetical protein IKQ92_02960 [Clostridia bacterium]|nr:hypothetical protein [Clostridia bacterium]
MKNSSLKKLLCLALALLMLTSALAACSESSNAKEGESGPADAGTDVDPSSVDTEPDETVSYDPGVPVNNYDGYTFTFYIRECHANFWTVKDIWVEGVSGDALNDAIYNRNQYINELYNIEVAQEFMGDNGACTTYINKMVSSGENMDAIICNGNDTTAVAGKSQLMNLKDVPYLNLEQKWWDQNSIHDLSLCGKTFFAAGELTEADNNAVNVIAFVKDNVTDYHLDDPYELVRNGTFTIDKFVEMSNAVLTDKNGDGKYNEDDVIGYLYFSDSGQTMFNALGNMCGRLNAEGDPEITFLTDRSAASWTKLISFIKQDCTLSMSTELDVYKGMGDYDVKVKMLGGKNTLFSWVHMRDIENLREIDSDFGILPNPKFDEAQTTYCNENDPYGTGFFSVPVSCANPERTGILIEAFSAKSMEIVLPAYYDITLQGKYMRDNDSQEMLDIIFDSVIYDIGRFYNWGSMYGTISNMWNGKQDTFASSFEKTSKIVNKAVERTLKAFSED